MLNTTRSAGGIATAPHHLAADAGRDVLRDGGNAVEAMIAMAGVIAVVYPHMNGIGGDGFWLVKPAGAAPLGIDACGAAGERATESFYLDAGHGAIPPRGPLAANTVAGTVSGWQAASGLAARFGGSLARERLLEPAIGFAESGFPVTAGQVRNTRRRSAELGALPGFPEAYLVAGAPPGEGSLFRQPRLAGTLRRLAAEGFDSFYRGALAGDIAADLERAGSPLSAGDLARHRAREVQPLSLRVSTGQLWNMPPPTQGLASLMILGLFDRLDVGEPESFAHIHGLVECVKQAFTVRDRHVQDPEEMDVAPAGFLAAADLDRRAGAIGMRRASPWPAPAGGGDTVWMGAIDRWGNAVSFIQSLFWEFGSGVVLDGTGILWQNRGASFALGDAAVNRLRPGRRPFHTLNPAMAERPDGSVLAYGTMGGEGQPQTQALFYTRHAQFGQGLQEAITAPRFVLGRTWGDTGTSLKLEARFGRELAGRLCDAGHDVEMIDGFSDLAGHAGAVMRRGDGIFEGAADPRADGRAAGL